MMKEMIKKILLISLLMVPVIFLVQLRNVFELPKITVIKLSAGFMLLLWLLDILKRKELEFKLNILDLVILIFIFTQFITLFYSIDILTSIFGQYFFYMWGILSVFSYIIYYFTIKNYDFKLHKNLINILIISAIFVSIYGIIQRAGLDFFNWPYDPGKRIWSTMGNPNFLGGFLGMINPFIIGSIIFENNVNKKIIKSFVSALIISCLIFSLSRAAWISFIVSTLFIFIFIGKKKLKENIYWIIAYGIILVFLMVLLKFENRKEIVSREVLERGRVLTEYKEQSAQTRIQGWIVMLKIIKEKPFLGWGIDTLDTVFPKYITLDFAKIAGTNMIQNYAHNEFLQILSTTGIPGLISYVLIFILCFISGNKIIKVYKNEEEKTFIILTILASIISYLVYIQFHFTTNSMFIVLFTVLSILSSFDNKYILNFRLKNANKILFIITGFAFSMFLSVSSISFLFADYNFNKGLKYSSSGNYDLAIEYYKKAEKDNPWLSNYKVALAAAYHMITDKTESIEEKKKYFEKSNKIYEKVLLSNKALFSNYANIGLLNIKKWRMINEGSIDDGIDYLLEARKYYFYSFDLLHSLGMAYSLKGDSKNAIKYYLAAKEISPANFQILNNISAEYLKISSNKEAITILEEMKKYRPDLKTIIDKKINEIVGANK